MIKKAWAAYAAALTAVVVLGETSNLVQGGTLNTRTFANWFVTAVLLLGTWGYALQRRIGAQYYWRTACWVVLGATLITLVPAVLAGGAAAFMVLVLLPLLVPAFVAVFLFAYRSPQLWASSSGDASLSR
jgi:hypothetical protein